MNQCPLVWIIIGVSGSGKTKIGRLWAKKLECDFLEGDRRHPLENINKMQSNISLEDADRSLWLQALAEDIKRAIALKRETVITCSALKQAYRQQLQVSELVQIVWIDLPESKLKQRLDNRKNHYMKQSMLDSQLATFEPLTSAENAIALDGLNSPEKVIEELFCKAREKFPTIEESWWKRTLNIKH